MAVRHGGGDVGERMYLGRGEVVAQQAPRGGVEQRGWGKRVKPPGEAVGVVLVGVAVGLVHVVVLPLVAMEPVHGVEGERQGEEEGVEQSGLWG